MKSKVVIVRNKKVWENDKIVIEILSAMLNEGILTFSGKETLEDAWSLYFKQNEKIAVKVNTITNDYAVSTHRELAELVGKGIASVGVENNNISFFDRGIKYDQDTEKYRYRFSLEKAGYVKSQIGNGFKYFEATEYGEWKQIGKIKNRFFDVFTEADGHVNMPILKDHHIMGVTFALKNYMGTLTNPELLHKNAGVPFIADLNAMHEVKGSLRLIIGDMLKCQYKNGPHNDSRYHWNENAIIISTDPVAIDSVAFEILKKKRRQLGIEWSEMAFGGTPGKYIQDAAERKSLGANDLNNIDLVEINQT